MGKSAQVLPGGGGRFRAELHVRLPSLSPPPGGGRIPFDATWSPLDGG